MKLATLVADDNFEAAENLQLLIRKHCPLLEVAGTARSQSDTLQMFFLHQPSVVFLSSGVAGTSTANLLAGITAKHASVIFVADDEPLAIKAIKFGAIDYLLKPLRADELQQAVSKITDIYMAANAGTAMPGSTKDTLDVYANGEHKMLNCNDIVALEALGAYTKVYTDSNHSFTLSRNIGYYAQLLCKNHFFRIHKSFLVNVSKIAAIDKSLRSIQLCNSRLYPVSVRQMPELLVYLNK